MTPDRMMELRKLCDAATPVPWSYEGNVVWAGPADVACICTCHSGVECGSAWRSEQINGRFIAAARTAVPELLDEVERLNSYAERLARECLFCETAGNTDEIIAAARAKLEAKQ